MCNTRKLIRIHVYIFHCITAFYQYTTIFNQCTTIFLSVHNNIFISAQQYFYQCTTIFLSVHNNIFISAQQYFYQCTTIFYQCTTIFLSVQNDIFFDSLIFLSPIFVSNFPRHLRSEHALQLQPNLTEQQH